MTEADKNYMALALELAERGAGWTSPNPMVGAVIVKDGAIIGQGYHARCGDLHAERAALKNCTGDPAGSTLYVTLEPCCHQGRQPPCTDAILQADIARVVVGSPDPNPLVAGKGVQILRDHGVQVEEGVLRTECDRLNRVFLKYIQTGRPYVIMKYAMTLDGKIAAYTGASQWVTGEEARAHVQTLRHRHRAIMAGVGTVIADDPRLTCRLPGGRDPIRVICDTHLRTPLTAQVVTTAGQTPTWIATCCADPERLAPYERAGCRMLVLPERDGPCRLKRPDGLPGEAGDRLRPAGRGRHPELVGSGPGGGGRRDGLCGPQALWRADGQDPGGGPGRGRPGGGLPSEKHCDHPDRGGLFAGERGGPGCLPASLRSWAL